MVISKYGIGYGTKSGYMFFDVAAMNGDMTPDPARPIENTTKEETSSQSKDFIPWGNDNKLPLQLLKSIETCGVLEGIIDSQSRFALGEGVLWAYVRRDKGGKMIVEEIADIPEITEFMEENNHYYNEYAWMRDQIGMANGMVRFMLNNERSAIATYQRDDITEMRYQVMQMEGERKGSIDNVFLCAQWDKITDVNDKSVVKVRLLDEKSPLSHLRELKEKTKEVEFALTFKKPGWNKKYYPLPHWYAAKKWVDIAEKIPVMKAAMYEHNFRPRYMVVIYEQFWDSRFQGDEEGNTKSWAEYTDEEREAKRQEVYDEIDQHLTGAENHGKALFVGGWIDPATGNKFSEIEITPIDDFIKEGAMLPDSAAANSEIAFSMRYNPAILGASLPSGPYTNSQGGSNVREAASLQIITLEPERMAIRRVYNIIKKFNGWDQKHAKPGLNLEPVMMNTILTTLDTGAGSKSVMLGADPGNNKQPQKEENGTD